MKRISVDELIDMVDSRYSLVTIISKRARQIIDGSEVMVKTNTIKPVGIAIEEFHESKYEAIYDYDKYKKALIENTVNDSEEEIVADEEADNSGEE
ncbi:DNA-directed RNA polymerase subunit omega [Sedimentibacter sp.]|uniref:DNA-directed RNA polymerase subunit omega n=1 Tax=Sedimentibacter sp. TaxID=1960295 RepID=UPI0028A7366B|nr:DNA-directed RNA polymerase subunit omega [Sedimentibacter sp.]